MDGRRGLLIAGIVLMLMLGLITFGIVWWTNAAAHAAGKYGKNMELRVVAVDLGSVQSWEMEDYKARGGAPVGNFSTDEATRIRETGAAPAGWRWVDVDEAIAKGVPEAIYRRAGGTLKMLVADGPDLAMTHDGDPWGLRTIEVTEHNESPLTWHMSLDVQMDDEGAKRFEELTRKNIKRGIAVIVSGHVIMVPHALMPISDGKTEITLGTDKPVPVARQEAEQLKTELMQEP